MYLIGIPTDTIPDLPCKLLLILVVNGDSVCVFNESLGLWCGAAKFLDQLHFRLRLRAPRRSPKLTVEISKLASFAHMSRS